MWDGERNCTGRRKEGEEMEERREGKDGERRERKGGRDVKTESSNKENCTALFSFAVVVVVVVALCLLRNMTVFHPIIWTSLK